MATYEVPEEMILGAEEAAAELHRASELYQDFNSGHEGWAAIKEEVDELWDEVKAAKDTRPAGLTVEEKSRMRKEAIQVAAMALRFVRDICS